MSKWTSSRILIQCSMFDTGNITKNISKDCILNCIRICKWMFVYMASLNPNFVHWILWKLTQTYFFKEKVNAIIERDNNAMVELITTQNSWKWKMKYGLNVHIIMSDILFYSLHRTDNFTNTNVNITVFGCSQNVCDVD